MGTRSVTPMLARVADNLYWMARAIERADTYARLLEVSHAMTRESDDIRGGARTVWEPLVEITGDLGGFLMLHDQADEASVMQFLAFSEENPNSIRSCVSRARQNAQAVRHLVPTDVWEALNAVHLDLVPGRTGMPREGIYVFTRKVRKAVALLHGLVDSSMRRDGSWYFLRLGRFIERAEKTARLLEVKYRMLLPDEPALVAGVDLHQWRSLLRSVGAYEASLQLYNGSDTPEEMVSLLVGDGRLPRSVAYSLDQVALSLTELVAGGDIAEADRPLELVAATRAELLEVVADGAMSLPAAMDRVQRRCNTIHNAIAASCFAYAPGHDRGMQHAQAAYQAQN